MKVRPPRGLDPAVVSRIADRLHQGVNPAHVIGEMRSLGLNKIESMKLLRDHAGIPLGEAKDLVHLSPTWADRYPLDERLHDVAEEAIQLDTEHAISGA